MSSRTPETLTAAQRAQRLNLQLQQKKVEADLPQLAPPMSQPKPPSKQVQQAIEKGRATLPPIAAKRSATADLDPRTDPDLSFMVLPIDQIEPYEHNPRTGANPNYEQIKASIKADGITNMLTVTRRDKHGKYTTYGGGNTRLRIAKELFAEGDQRFATLHVLFKEWPGDAQVITAHLVENENRADITFWEKAQGVQMFRTEFERENGKPLTAGELNRELKDRGLNYGIRTLQNFAFAVEQLASIGPWLKARSVNELLRPMFSQLLELGTKLNQGAALRQRLNDVMVDTAEYLNKTIATNEDLDPEERLPVELDDTALVNELEQAAADALGIDVPTLTAMLAALAANPRITPGQLRATLVVPVPTPGWVDPAAAPAEETDQAQPSQRQAMPPAAPPITPTPAVGPVGVTQSPSVQAPVVQAPLPGMLASVPVATPPRMPVLAEKALAVQPSDDVRDHILETLAAMNVPEMPLIDVVRVIPEAPFGFIVDFPKIDLAHVDSEPLADHLVPLRTAAWRVLAAISGQCDHRVATKLARYEGCLWGQFFSQGPEAFAAACEARTGVRFQNGAFIWEMNDLGRVMADACAINFIHLFTHMEQLRLNEEDEMPMDYVPLFSEGVEHA